MRKTKIVATLGPASSTPEMIEKLVHAGMDVARLNFSHGTLEEHRARLAAVRTIAQKRDQAVACLQDLSGPKIRTGPMAPPGGVDLKDGARFVITTDDVPGDAERVSTTYKHLPRDVGKGNRILVDDGLLELIVDRVDGEDVVTEVVSGGVLTSSKGINLPGVRLSAPALTDKDRADVVHGLDLDVDFMAMSFVRKKDDIQDLRAVLREHGREDLHIIAKIERPEAVENLSEILSVANGVMVARGDLGVELPPETVPTLQKEIIREANQRGRPVITATQMLESMVSHVVPTRAEASDIANAILDGTDALMLSAEIGERTLPGGVGGDDGADRRAHRAAHRRRPRETSPVGLPSHGWLAGSPRGGARGAACRGGARRTLHRRLHRVRSNGATREPLPAQEPYSRIHPFGAGLPQARDALGRDTDAR